MSAGACLNCGAREGVACVDDRCCNRDERAATAGPWPQSVPKNRHSMADKLVRIMALDKAGSLIGKGVLSARTGMPDRTLRSYASVERDLPAHVLIVVADALDAHCAEISAHAAKLRGLATPA